MDNFDLRKYLAENILLKENETPQWLEALEIKARYNFLNSQETFEYGKVRVNFDYDDYSNLLEISVNSPNMMKYYQSGPLIAKEVDDMLNEVSDEYNVEFKMTYNNMEDFESAHRGNNPRNSPSSFERNNYQLTFVYKVTENNI